MPFLGGSHSTDIHQGGVIRAASGGGGGQSSGSKMETHSLQSHQLAIQDQRAAFGVLDNKKQFHVI